MMNNHVWVVDITMEDPAATQLTPDNTMNFFPTWSPDSTMIAYVARVPSGAAYINQLAVVDVATTTATIVVNSNVSLRLPAFSPAGCTSGHGESTKIVSNSSGRYTL